MAKFSRVAVALNMGELSKMVIPVASKLADLSGAGLWFVHSTTQVQSAVELLAQLHLTPEEIKNGVLDQILGPPEDAIPAALAKHQDSLLVLPFPENLPTRERELGPVALAVLRKSNSPVVFVPAAGNWSSWNLESILLPQDSTEECATAVRPIFSLLGKNQSRLIVLHVPTYSPGTLSPSHHALPFPRYLDQPQHAIRAWREEFIGRIRQLAQIPEALGLELILGKERPATEILSCSRQIKADLIVLPWHRDLVSGHVLRAVLDETSCPVLCIPISAAAQSEREAA